MDTAYGRSKESISSTMIKKLKSCMELGVRASGPLFVLLASGLITAVIVLHFRLIIPYYGKHFSSLPGIINTIISTYISANLFFNYYMIVFTPPGYSSDANSIPQPDEEVMMDSGAPRKGEGFSKFCKSCKRSKPERSHHCHVCKRCVLKMDHHCPWVSNCVGLNNHRYFVLFLFYLWAGCFYVAVVTYFPFINTSLSDQAWNGHSVLYRGMILFVFVITITITLALSFMLSWQMYLVLTGQTTIEFYYNRFKMGQARARGERFENVYNHGVRKNFDLFFGSTRRSPIFAFLPSTRMPVGTGAEKRSEEGYYL